MQLPCCGHQSRLGCVCLVLGSLGAAPRGAWAGSPGSVCRQCCTVYAQQVRRSLRLHNVWHNGGMGGRNRLCPLTPPDRLSHVVPMDHVLAKGGLSGTVRAGDEQENPPLLTQAAEARSGAAL